jgi:predicted NAD-dependent protein-ADP-ribosyltransferase YbiA (DUF1768 family)
MNNNKTLIDAIDEYYRLKNAYVIKNSKLGNKKGEKKENVKKCIQCNGVGGTFFGVKMEDGSRFLLASCDAKPKCKLNIRIDAGFIINLKNEITNLTTNDYQRMNDAVKNNNTTFLNKEIIIAKNNILYGYERVEEIEKRLRELLEDVDLQNYAVTSYKTDLFSITENNTKILEIQELKKSITEAIGTIKKLVNTYRETHAIHLLEESDVIYSTILLPKSNELRNKIYSIQEVESSISPKSLETIYTLNQQKYQESSFEVQMNLSLADIVIIMNDDTNKNTINKPPRTKKTNDKTKKTREKPEKEDENKEEGEEGEGEGDENVIIKGKLKTSRKPKKKVKEDIPKKHEVDRETIQELPRLIKGYYTDTIIFCIYDKAPDVVPGKGKYEKIPDNDISEFKTLETFSQWRTRLSNTHHSVFVLDNHKWYSVYHYYVACQFKLSNPEFYLSFSMDSGSPISRSVTKAREASDMSKETSLRNPDITADEDYYSGPRHLEELFYGTYANINQHEDLKRILINTRNAKLMRYVKKDNVSKFVIDTDLIYIRFLLNAKEREIDEAAKASEKIGGGVRFGGNDIRIIEPTISIGGDNDSDDGGGYDDEEQVILGGELDMDSLGAEEM